MAFASTAGRPNRASALIRAPNHAKLPVRFETPLLAFLGDAGIRTATPSAQGRRLWNLARGFDPSANGDKLTVPS